MASYMRLTIQAKEENVAFGRNCVAMFCVSANPTIEVLEDIKSVVSEAITNCVVHAYEDIVGEIDIECKIIDNVLHIEIRDYGRGISDIEKALTPYFSTQEDGERAGIGFTIMQSFCDNFCLKNNDNGGVSVFLQKNLLNEG